jgi:hypothetical protein
MSEAESGVLARVVCWLVGHDFGLPEHHPPESEYFTRNCRRCGVAYSAALGARDE